MQRPQLEHLIRAAAEITNQYEFVVIGSQLALARCAQLPDADEAARALAWTRRLCAELPAA